MHGSHHPTRKLQALALSGLFLLSLLLVACGSVYGTNPLGYGYAYDQMASPTPRGIVLPTMTPVPHPDLVLRQAGLGNTLDTFLHKYVTMTISRPPNNYAFQQTLDTWPGGSILFTQFENGTQDQTARAVQFSLVPGTNHPTTYEQAEAWAQSLLPSDRTGPTTVQGLDTKNFKCLAMVWNSADLAKTFPPEDFLGNLSGKLGKPGDVIVSFFPHIVYNTSTTGNGDPATSLGHNPNGDDDSIDNADIVGSVLIALGDRPSC
jgi:hypothetical protein